MEKLTPLQIIGAVMAGLVAAGAVLALSYWLISGGMSDGDDPQRQKHRLPSDLESGQLYLPPPRDHVPMSAKHVPSFAALTAGRSGRLI